MYGKKKPTKKVSKKKTAKKAVKKILKVAKNFPNYYTEAELSYVKLIKNEKQKMAESKLKDLVTTVKNMAKNKDIGISQLFNEYSLEKDFISFWKIITKKSDF